MIIKKPLMHNPSPQLVLLSIPAWMSVPGIGGPRPAKRVNHTFSRLKNTIKSGVHIWLLQPTGVSFGSQTCLQICHRAFKFVMRQISIMPFVCASTIKCWKLVLRGVKSKLPKMIQNERRRGAFSKTGVRESSRWVLSGEAGGRDPLVARYLSRVR